PAVMRVPVKDGGDGITSERFLETAASEERKDLRGLPFDGRLNRRIVQDRDAAIVPQPGERRLELQRFVHRFVDELLDDVFAPRSEGAAAEASGEPLHTGKADAEDLGA